MRIGRVSGHIPQTRKGSYEAWKSAWNPILWAIVHENHHKNENDEFLVISLKHVRVLTRHANPPGTQKLWAIARENSHKTRNLQVLGHISPTCKGSYEACKSAWNPKTVGNSS